MKKTCASLIIIFTTACVTPRPEGGDSAATTTVPSPVISGWQSDGPQTRVLLSSDCVMQPHTSEANTPKTREFVLGAGAAAVVSAVLPKIVNAVTDAGAAYLERRKSQLQASSTGLGTQQLYEPSIDKPGAPPVTWWRCMAFVRGQVGPAPTTVPVGSKWTANALATVGLKSVPDVYLESWVGYATDQSAFLLQPVYLEYNKTAAKRGTKKKDLLFTGSFDVLTTSDSTVEMKKFGDFQIAFDDVPLGSRFEEKDLRGFSSQWIALPQPRETEVRDFDAEPDEKSNEPAMKKTWSLMPFSATVTLQESEEAGDLLLNAIKVADDSKADVSKALLEHLERQWGLKAEEKDDDEKDDEKENDN